LIEITGIQGYLVRRHAIGTKSDLV
jgi:hypothetical protein